MTNQENLKSIEAQIRQIDRQLSKFDTQLARMDHGIAALQTLSSQKNANMLVQVTDGIFVNATISQPENTIIAVGADVAVKKDIKDTILLLQQQKEMSLHYQQKLFEKLELLSQKADELVKAESAVTKVSSLKSNSTKRKEQ
jgi:prefoldin alpha subunit